MSVHAFGPVKLAQFSLEECACCNGTGYRCRICDGHGLVLVREPAARCEHCGGTGLERNRSSVASRLCVTCSGSGWAAVVRKSA
jgi:DnaJ-class molecular chaperone